MPCRLAHASTCVAKAQTSVHVQHRLWPGDRLRRLPSPRPKLSGCRGHRTPLCSLCATMTLAKPIRLLLLRSTFK